MCILHYKNMLEYFVFNTIINKQLNMQNLKLLDDMYIKIPGQ